MQDIVKWLGGDDTGLSSKAIALTALGSMPDNATTSYPHDGGDFGRCKRLIDSCPSARIGLDKLATDGGPYWRALASRWAEIDAAFTQEEAGGGRGLTYDLMRKILDPIEAEDRNVVSLGSGLSLRFGGR